MRLQLTTAFPRRERVAEYGATRFLTRLIRSGAASDLLPALPQSVLQTALDADARAGVQ